MSFLEIDLIKLKMNYENPLIFRMNTFTQQQYIYIYICVCIIFRNAVDNCLSLPWASYARGDLLEINPVEMLLVRLPPPPQEISPHFQGVTFLTEDSEKHVIFLFGCVKSKANWQQIDFLELGKG